jgi:tetratricopeptide (TPR) repeat protein
LFAKGLYRRAIGILNCALQDGANLVEAWFLKSRFLNSIGFNRSAAEMLEGAIARFTNTKERTWILEEQSFLWAECGEGDRALRSAEAARALGSNSVRTHYLRGRALALVGRLEDAREEMTSALGLDPENADAQRGLKMINEALGQKADKPWWQFWRT